MAIVAWWIGRDRRALTAPCPDDEQAINRHAPEVAGMDPAKAAAFVRSSLALFHEGCLPIQEKILAAWLSDARRVWQAQGLAMPYWGNLVVLRSLQAEIALQTLPEEAPLRPADTASRPRPEPA
jgi:hypothetical protein